MKTPDNRPNLGVYAIRDRLLDYFWTPFCAADDKAVLAGVSTQLNNPEVTNAICQAPHHFEIWKLGEVDQFGHLISKIDFLADCTSLLRPSVRNQGTPGTDTTTNFAPKRTGSPTGGGGNTHAQPSAVPHAQNPEAGTVTEAHH